MHFAHNSTLFGFRFQRITNGQLLYGRNKFCFETLVNALFYQDAGTAKADLALVCKGGLNCSFHHFIPVTVRKNDIWVLAAQF
ncbi:hypothetical protein D3C87_2058460 [compost metagenome]